MFHMTTMKKSEKKIIGWLEYQKRALLIFEEYSHIKCVYNPWDSVINEVIHSKLFVPDFKNKNQLKSMPGNIINTAEF